MARRFDNRVERLKAQVELLKRQESQREFSDEELPERTHVILSSDDPRDHQRKEEILEILEVARKRQEVLSDEERAELTRAYETHDRARHEELLEMADRRVEAAEGKAG